MKIARFGVNEMSEDHQRIPTDLDVCEVQTIDEAKVSRLRPRMIETEGVATLFKALADDTRAKIIYALALEGELCVCDVAATINSSIPNTSHHLRLLKNMGLARYRKNGKPGLPSSDYDDIVVTHDSCLLSSEDLSKSYHIHYYIQVII